MRSLLSSLVLCCSLVCLSHNPRYHGHHGAVIGEDTSGLPSRWVLHPIPCLCSLCAPPFGTRESSEVLPACSAEHSLSVPASLQHRVLIMLSTSLLKKEIHCTHFCRWAVQACLLSPLNIVVLQVLCRPASSLDSGWASRASPFFSGFVELFSKDSLSCLSRAFSFHSAFLLGAHHFDGHTPFKIRLLCFTSPLLQELRYLCTPSDHPLLLIFRSSVALVTVTMKKSSIASAVFSVSTRWSNFALFSSSASIPPVTSNPFHPAVQHAFMASADHAFSCLENF